MAASLRTMDRFNLSAGWERSTSGKRRCRWFVAWRQGFNTAFGAVAGYAGGGSFICEKFYCEFNEGKVNQLIVGEITVLGVGKGSSAAIPSEISVICEDALDSVFSWHEHAPWEEFESLYLIADKQAGLEMCDDLLYLRGPDDYFVATVCRHSGLTAAPFPPQP